MAESRAHPPPLTHVLRIVTDVDLYDLTVIRWTPLSIPRGHPCELGLPYEHTYNTYHTTQVVYLYVGRWPLDQN